MPDPVRSPVGGPAHGVGLPRGLESTAASSSTRGRFGRMFRHLPVYEVAPQSLIALGSAMVQPLEQGMIDKPLGVPDDDENTALDEKGDGLRLPAGYTYFGQFVDHDITFDPVSSLTRQNDPDALTDFRTPRFDLDSLYGRGPADQPYLYDPDGLHLTLGRNLDPGGSASVKGSDLLRVATGRAVIGDPRNDENLIISQLQAAFISFHNMVVERVRTDAPALSGPDLLERAQQVVRWHYQWIVVHDFLRRLVGSEVLADILEPETYVASAGPDVGGRVLRPRLRFFAWQVSPYVPVEFSTAAYRFGHSMIRPSYVVNDHIALPRPGVTDAHRVPLFSAATTAGQNLNGFRPLANGWGVQWKYFLPHIDGPTGPNDKHLPQPSYQIDEELGHPLGSLPDSVAGPEALAPGASPAAAKILSVRNLLRGLRMGLPAGQDVARAMGISPLGDRELFDGIDLDVASRADLAGRAPLWFYVLREAKLCAGGAHLGPVGGRIVAEVLIGLLSGDPLSYLRVHPTWRPTLPSHTPGHFTLSDLINVARPGMGAN